MKNTLRLDYSKYQLKLVSDHMDYDGQQYYEFQLQQNGRQYGPSLIVSRDNGVLLCYYQNGTAGELYEDKVFGANF